MASSIDKIVDDIIKDNENTLNNIVAFMAKMVEWDWEVEVNKTLDGYYSDHMRGNRYKNRRTKSLHDNVYITICERSGDGMYRAGIEFDPSRMHHDPLKQFNEEGIFENFMTGMHGNIPYTIPGTGEKIERNIKRTSPDAQTILDNYYKNYDKKMDTFFKAAKNMFG